VPQLQHLFDSNQLWARRMERRDPGFFARLSNQQSPAYLWIGCSDSRVPANEIVGLLPGELFVHRNIANLVVHTDLNCLSVMQFAVEVLQVRHIIVCGHYGCSGVRAALRRQRLGLCNNWLRHIEDIYKRHDRQFLGFNNENEAADRLCELNVIEQVQNTCRTTIVTDAWEQGQELTIHGWIYGLQDGLLHDLGMTIGGAGEIELKYEQAVNQCLLAGV
jgi:carbonic anhydrase